MARLYILGAGTPTPTPTRFGSAYVLEIEGEKIMFDCGPATTHKLVQSGLWPLDIDYIFFTHHHFDHDIDYPCFLLTRFDQSIGKENQLQVFGPTLTEKITEGVIGENGIFSHDWKARIYHPLSQKVYMNRGGVMPRRAPKIAARDVGVGTVHTAKNWEVTSANAEHVQPYLDSLAYRIETKSGKSVVFTGDTQPCQSIIDLAKGADVLISMCWDDQECMDADGESPGQCGTTGAARMAEEAGVKKLILVHMGAHIASHGPLEKGIGDIREAFSGQVIFSEELMAIDV
ncbi:MBL fold metallo-hydrolase [Candidatus Lucifugimonas marina]|jgi:ribonuclease BN (tRNA processing enzyme)|uniref:MBL fold metallo-hydrolase n=1 Tax=Candidatus Lucifugimonas marina TaxID=3038979 RepID=A0AAJ5ZEZ6_9CHLR|nr:MBL fold metallo-hydrolase [SAR202 cluster bacterium JH702]MDG0869198.1 MBL fold metallo-hydrolase [SAR202 cluster bacterium JH639]WFG35815.1 MBL fold metallo-hydrolase [SAR202 cluster bacterium JH545]WFG39760.1 MBL fold metallo-hydrolase [SAR202 cluster bacterium JH1073]